MDDPRFDDVLEAAMAAEAARVRRAHEDEVARFRARYAEEPRRAEPTGRREPPRSTSRVTHAESPFSSLGLVAGASVDDVRRAFRQRAYATHPDRGGSMAAFVALEAAYRAALDLASRAA